jgi:hypothetical protein
MGMEGMWLADVDLKFWLEPPIPCMKIRVSAFRGYQICACNGAVCALYYQYVDPVFTVDHLKFEQDEYITFLLFTNTPLNISLFMAFLAWSQGGMCQKAASLYVHKLIHLQITSIVASIRTPLYKFVG